MSSSSAHRIDEKAIFNAARRIADAASRDAYLAEACGSDSTAAQRIRRLLEIDATEPTFLEPPATLVAATDVLPIAEQPGTVIGPYTLLQLIGEGGFGLVFVAEQDHPIRRRVALKVIKPGMDTRQVIARFEAERQALALMDHPNIAKVYDAGATENGRPYFVMELVQGLPITDYCDQCNLTMDERLALFVTVCQAMQHAHQKGVIHRDIKPTNVLVAMQDGQPAPKIIDFGIAKAIDQRLTEQTLTAAFAEIVGTPLYMSPEQAELSPLGVDTRSDIYSLGVLLYELLTGSTPFDKARLHAAAFDEFRRIIREEEPPRPSTRLSMLDAEVATAVAGRRGTDFRRLLHSVRGDLDWIVMKCLEKDRNRRYDSAGSLAQDAVRYLHDEPVQACPPSAAYRLKKLIRRNKIAAAFVLLLAVAVAALAVSNVMVRRERDAKTTALTRAETVSDLLREMLALSNPNQLSDSQYTVRELLDEFSDGLGDRLSGEPEVEAAIRSVIGSSYRRLGALDRAEPHLKKSLFLRRQSFGDNDERVGESLIDYAWILTEQRRFEEAESRAREALSIYRSHGSNPPPTVGALFCLQEILLREGRLAEAEQVAHEALALADDGKNTDSASLPNILHSLADMKVSQGNYQEAEKLARRSVELHRRLQGDHHLETAWGLWILGSALRGQQKLAAAEAPLRESLAIFRENCNPGHRAIEGVSQELASVLEAKGDRAGLAGLTSELIERASRSDTPGDRVRLAKILLEGNSQRQNDEAHRLIRRAIEEYGQVATGDPNDLNSRLKAAMGSVELIRLCAKAPGFESEVDEANRRLSTELQQITLNVQRLSSPVASADALYSVALIQLRLGDQPRYRATCQALLDLPGYAANEAIESRPIWIACLAPNSIEDLTQLVTRAEKLVANCDSGHRHFCLYILGAAQYRSGQYEQAAEKLEESIAAYPAAPPTGYDTISFQQLLLAMTHWKLGKREAARQLLAESQSQVEEELRSPATSWNRRTTLELLLDEAEALIAPQSPDEGRGRQSLKSKL